MGETQGCGEREYADLCCKEDAEDRERWRKTICCGDSSEKLHKVGTSLKKKHFIRFFKSHWQLLPKQMFYSNHYMK